MSQPKQVCKNKESGKYFLFIEETNDEKLLLVIPMGEVKSLDSFLFEDTEEVDISDLLNKGFIAQQQIDGYKKFVKEDSIRLFKEIMRSVADTEDILERLKICQKHMSRMQYEFVVNRLEEYVTPKDH